jgi:hypothetical protein
LKNKLERYSPRGFLGWLFMALVGVPIRLMLLRFVLSKRKSANVPGKAAKRFSRW